MLQQYHTVEVHTKLGSMCLQGCPLLLGLAAQHNQISSFPSDLPCLLLRMLNLNGNRYMLSPKEHQPVEVGAS